MTSATTVAAGNVLVSITDVSNTSTVNDVYYFYSTDGTTFANTNILAGSTASPYSLFLNLQDISNTIYVRATNSLGNSATANIRALVYQEPRNPPIFGVSLVGSGNLQVTVGENDGISTIPNYYYLNNSVKIKMFFSVKKENLKLSNSMNFTEEHTFLRN